MYAYDNKYIFSGNISRMASDNFAPEERWGTFTVHPLGWVASEVMVEKQKYRFVETTCFLWRAGQSSTGAGGILIRYLWWNWL